uniref:UDENN domain-containing protein n=1 Tax=Paramoeba aestuarina TaxID=180227 RepID=A0A7S4KU55_9EUKA
METFDLFWMPKNIQKLTFRCPPIRENMRGELGVEGTMIADWCLLTTFRALSLPSLLSIFSSALLEKPILFVSSNLWLLSSVVFSVSVLLQPLKWQGLQAPILPSKMHDLLDAPVPYLFGVQKIPEKRNLLGTAYDRSEWEGVIVDIERNTVIVKNNPLSSLPQVSKLEKKLKVHAESLYTPNQVFHPATVTMKEMNTVNDVLWCFLQYTKWLSDAISASLLVAFKDIFGADFSMKTTISASATIAEHGEYKRKKEVALLKFLKKIAPQNQAFVDKFIQTQMFTDYSEKK